MTCASRVARRDWKAGDVRDQAAALLDLLLEAVRRIRGGLRSHIGVAFDDREVNVVKGDARCAAVSCASIIAKVERDAYMRSQAAAYPAYGFADRLLESFMAVRPFID